MADNVTADPGSGGATFKTDEDTGASAHVPVTKIELGANNTFDGYVASGNPMPSEISDGTNTIAVAVEDAAAAANPAGIPAMGVRDDLLDAAVVSADGDHVALRASTYGAQYTAPGNFVSTNNSTTTPLGISANFTGTGDDCAGFSSVTIMLDSDQDSATDGMDFEWSSDNTNWDYTHNFTYTAADGGRIFQLPVCARYFRVNYTNGGTGQTNFRVQTILHANSVNTTVHRLGDNISADRSAEVMKTALFAQINGTGDFTAIDADAAGNLDIGLTAVGGTATDVNTGNAGNGTQRVVLASNQPVVSVDDNGANLSVDFNGTNPSMGTGVRDAGTQRVTIATDDVVPASQSGTWNITNVSGTVSLPTGAATQTTLADVETNTDFGTVTGGGTETGALRVTLANDSTGTLTVDNAGTFAVQADLGSNNDVQGAGAHDVGVTGNPFLMAGEARTSLPTAVANGDAVRLQADDDGRLVTQPMSPRDMINTSTNRVALTTTTRTELIAAAGVGVFNDLVSITMSNESATEVRVDVYDLSTGGTAIFSVDLAADGGGATINLPVPYPQATANNAWDVELSGAVSTVYVTGVAVERQ